MMGRKNRKKPFKCPVLGCDKRGQRADLMRHASAVHPDWDLAAYGRQIVHRAGPAQNPTGSVYRFQNGPWKPLSMWPSVSLVLSAITIIGLVAWGTFFR